LAEDEVGEPSFEAAQRFFAGLAGGEFAFVGVTAGAGRVAKLGHCGQVQGVVDAAAPCPGEAAALLFARGAVDGRGAVVAGEVVFVGEACRIALGAAGVR
jgi:hypothetical protein